MPSIFGLDYIDATYMTALLLTKRKDMLEGGVIHVGDTLQGNWPTLRRAVIALAALGARVNDGVVPKLSRITIERFKPGAQEDWVKGEALELTLPLVSGPGMMVYAERESMVPLNGLAYARAPGVMWSLVNHGMHNSILLRAFIDGDRDEFPADMAED